MTIRNLPKGEAIPVRVRLLEGRQAAVELKQEFSLKPNGAFSLNQPVELSDAAAVYLGVVAQVEEPAGGPCTVWLDLEHRVDRGQLGDVQAAWGWEEKSLKDVR